MLIKADIKIIKDLLNEALKDKPSKDEFRQFAKKSDILRLERDELRLEEEILRLVNKTDNFKNDLVQFKDDILTEIVKLREDVEIVVGYRDLIENHELRIDKLEKVAKTI